MVTSLQLYEKEWDSIWEEAGLMGVKGGGFTAHLGKPDGVTCKDYHSECSRWADEVCKCSLDESESAVITLVKLITSHQSQKS